jgi:hypothetical protein
LEAVIAAADYGFAIMGQNEKPRRMDSGRAA